MSNENPTGLEFSDIQSALAVIDYAADQGAFKGWAVINQVSALRSRIAVFLDAVAAAQKAQADAEAAAKGETPASDVADVTDEEVALAPGA